MKAFHFTALFLIIILTMTLMLALGVPAFADSGDGNMVVNILIGLIGTPVVQGAIVFILLGLLSWAFAKNLNARHIVNLAILAYEYAEREGLAKKLKGYEKFDPFMDRFITEYKLKFGSEPTPAEKGLAVQTMESKVLEEHQPGK